MPKGPFRRSASNALLGGVCAGLARYFGIDTTLARILWVILTIISLGAGLIGYALIWILVDKE